MLEHLGQRPREAMYRRRPMRLQLEEDGLGLLNQPVVLELRHLNPIAHVLCGLTPCLVNDRRRFGLELVCEESSLGDRNDRVHERQRNLQVFPRASHRQSLPQRGEA